MSDIIIREVVIKMKKVKGNSKVFDNKKLIVVFIIIIIFVLGFYLFPIRKYEYTSLGGSNSIVRINKYTRVVHAEFSRYCDLVGGCEDIDTTYKCTVKLTSDEYKKLKKLWWRCRGGLSAALESICKGNEIFEHSKAEYDEYDINSDGKITYREFGNKSLDYLIKEEIQGSNTSSYDICH